MMNNQCKASSKNNLWMIRTRTKFKMNTNKKSTNKTSKMRVISSKAKIKSSNNLNSLKIMKKPINYKRNKIISKILKINPKMNQTKTKITLFSKKKTSAYMENNLIKTIKIWKIMQTNTIKKK